MNILYVSSHDQVGQQFNGYLLLNELRSKGFDARMFVQWSQIDRPGVVYHPEGKVRPKLNHGLSRLEKELSLHSILPIHSGDITKSDFYKNADIVHLQLIHASQFLSLLSLPKLGREKKLVFTLHDPWMLTGHCVHPMECQRWKTGCGKCPDLKRPFSIKTDTTALTWKLKKYIMDRTKVHLVVASRWMGRMVEKSPILSHLPRSIIPLGLVPNVFKPLDKRTCKKALGIPEDAFVVSFRAVPFSPFKGVEYIERALLNLKQPSQKQIWLLAFDSVGLIPNLTRKFKTIELGWMDESAKIVEALNASDVFLMPSTAEAFGMMAVESMSCGTPVIVFEGTALPSVIQAPRGGIAVPSEDPEALRIALESLMKNPGFYNELAKNGPEIVNEEYTVEKYVARHLELYKRLCDVHIT